MEREEREGAEDEVEATASAEEPGAEDGVDEDGRAGGTQEPEDFEDDSEVDAQRWKHHSDATLKRRIAAIGGAIAALR